MKHGIVYLIIGGLTSIICTCTATPTMCNVYGGIFGGMAIAYGLIIVTLAYEAKRAQAKENTAHD